MSNVTVCARFRPLSSKEKRDHGDTTCIESLDAESFIFKDEKEEDMMFNFDRVFYQDSEQADVYEFLALPIVQDAVNGINGTIMTYGQTGAGKTYSMEGSSILERDEQKKGLLPRVVDGIFECLKSADEMTKYTVKLSMVEIYLEKVRFVLPKDIFIPSCATPIVEIANLQVNGFSNGIPEHRDLFDLSKDNLQIKEGKALGIFLSGVTEIFISDTLEALCSLSSGIANRAVGETQMNMASSRSHCAYIFTVQQEMARDRRVKTGKLILLDLAGSEKVEKTGAEGRVLEEAKTINKSLSALGNVIYALTSGIQGKANHIPYRDSKLTRILQDALGGNSRTAVLCCCSPGTLNASESLSTLRFGARAKHIKTLPRTNYNEYKCIKKQMVFPSATEESCERILSKLREKLNVEDVKLLEELFIVEGIFFDPNSVVELESAYDDITFRTVSSLYLAVEELESTVKELKRERKVLKVKLAAAERLRFDLHHQKAREDSQYLDKISYILSFFFSWVLGSLSGKKNPI